MYIIKVSPKLTKMFMAERDYLNYVDYMENGLKVVRKECRAVYFNDGAILTDVSLKGESPKRYVLHKEGKKFKDTRYTKKYVEIAEA